MPGPDGKFGALHPDKIDEGNSNFFGLDPENDIPARDDIQSGELVVPVNKEIHLMMHAKDVGHSFYVRELRIQQDFVPGLDLSLHFTATKVGKYEIVCTQLVRSRALQHEGVSERDVAGRFREVAEVAVQYVSVSAFSGNADGEYQPKREGKGNV